MKKRALALLLALVLLVGMIPMPAAAVYYNIGDALAYAQAHCYDNVGECAEFVSRCLQAGGLFGSGSVYKFAGPCIRAAASASGFSIQKLSLGSGGHATKALDGSILGAGDVVAMYCETCDLYPHVMLCGGYNSSGQATYYAHNNAKNNQPVPLNSNTLHKKSTCRVVGHVVHLSGIPGSDVPPVGTTSRPSVTVGDRTATVSWTYTGSATGFDIYLVQSPWGWNDIKYHGWVSSSARSYTFTDVAPGTYSAFTVARPNGDQTQSEWTSFNIAIVRAPQVNISVNAYSNPNIALSWNAVSNADYYRVRIYDGNDVEIKDPVILYQTSYSTYLNTGTYHVQVDAVNIAESVYSSNTWEVVVPAHTHNWDGGRVTKNATVSATGEVTYTCLICSQTKTSTTPKLTEGSGVCGENVTWTYNSITKTLTLSGTGKTRQVSVGYVLSDWYEFYTDIQKIVVEPGITEIGGDIFSGFKSLTQVSLPESVTTIGRGVFRGCTSLRSINIPNGVTTINKSTFSGCTSLQSIDIPNGVTSIEERAFEGCTGLRSVDIPDGVTTLGEYAFSGCTNLSTVNIPESVVDVGGFAFKGTVWVKAIPGDFPVFRGGLMDYRGTAANVVIPDSVQAIPSGLFNGNTEIRSVVIPGSVKKIGDRAFWYCSNLSKVTIGEGVTEIEDWAFADTALTEVVIPNSVNKLGYGVFFECTALRNVAVSYGVTRLGAKTFQYCQNMTVIIPETVVRIGETDFWDCKNVTIRGVAGSYAQTYVETYGQKNGLTFQALERYNVTFNANGGQGVPAGQTKTEGADLTLSDVTPAKTGYTFQSWNTAANGSGATYEAGGSYTEDAAVTLYAQWQANAYTVAYHANGGSGAMADTPCVYNAQQTLRTNTFTRPGYTFLGWALEPDGELLCSDGEVISNLTAQAGATVTLYAVWEMDAAADPEEADIVLSLSSATVRPGERVTIDLTVDSAKAVYNTLGATRLLYDTNVLTFLGFVDSGELVTAAALPSLDDDNATITLGYTSATARTGKICSLEFQATDSVEEAVAVTVSMTSLVKNGSVEIVSAVKSGTVTVADLLPGDLTGNDTVDIDDAIALLRYSMFPELYPVSYKGAMDFNKDGRVDIDDAIALLRYSMFPDVYPLGV